MPVRWLNVSGGSGAEQQQWRRPLSSFTSLDVFFFHKKKLSFLGSFLFSFPHHQLSYQLFDRRTAELISSLAQEVSADMKGTASHVLIQLWDLAAGGLRQEH